MKDMTCFFVAGIATVVSLTMANNVLFRMVVQQTMVVVPVADAGTVFGEGRQFGIVVESVSRTVLSTDHRDVEVEAVAIEVETVTS